MNVRKAVHATRREGDSLKAKFFRWKDRVMKDKVLKDLLDEEARFPTERYLTLAEGENLRLAMDALADHPDDRAAYVRAVSLFKTMAVKIKELGGDVDPDASEE